MRIIFIGTYFKIPINPRGGTTQFKHQQNLLALIAKKYFSTKNAVLAAVGLIHCMIPSFPLFNLHLMNE